MSGMGGSRDAGGRRSRAAERLLEAASELFYREGIRAVGVDTVVERAGVAKMTLYNRFGGKDGLVTEYLRVRDERWRVSLVEITARYEDPEERLLAAFEAYGRWLVGDDFRGCAFINAVSELPDPNHPARAVVLDHKEGVRTHLRALAEEAGLEEPDLLAERLMLLLEGATAAATVRRSAEPLYTARATARLLIGGSRGGDAAP